MRDVDLPLAERSTDVRTVEMFLLMPAPAAVALCPSHRSRRGQKLYTLRCIFVTVARVTAGLGQFKSAWMGRHLPGSGGPGPSGKNLFKLV